MKLSDPELCVFERNGCICGNVKDASRHYFNEAFHTSLTNHPFTWDAASPAQPVGTKEQN